jgi:P27 family predicted phage terminase small subunit
MGLRGPKPRNAALKRAAGIAPSHTGGDPAPPLPGPLVCPRDLDAVARKEFHRIVGMLKQSKTLSRTDAPAIVLYARTYSQWMKAEAEIKDRGILIESAGGVPKPNPAIVVSNRCKHLMIKLLVQFGFTPNARERAAPLSAAVQGDMANRKTAGTYLKIAAERKPG